MRAWLSCLLALAACSPGDDTADGTRALCAEGGALNDCPDSARTPEAACWRLVDCGAIDVHRDNNDFDWDDCVSEIEREAAVQQRLIIGCVAAATCDQLKFDTDRCFAYGDN